MPDNDTTNQSLDFEPGVLAGIDVSEQPDINLTEDEKNALAELRRKAARRDYPARLTEVMQAWEARLFWRLLQYLVPGRNGGTGWTVNGEPGSGISSGQDGYGIANGGQLPTDITVAYGSMIIAALTRQVPPVTFGPQDPSSAIDVTAADSAEDFVRVIEKNNDLLGIQTDAARYLWTDGRTHYWTRFVRDGQQFGWESEDETPVVPETEPLAAVTPPGEQQALGQTASPSATGNEEPNADQSASGQTSVPTSEEEVSGMAEGESQQPVQSPRKPRGQEVRTAYGKLEVKIDMKANELASTPFLRFSEESDLSIAKGMFPKVADKLTAGNTSIAESEIDRLARINCKLGMQATYVTSDSQAEDVTVDRNWFRPAYLLHIKDKVIRDGLLSKFPDGCYATWVGETFCRARNESMDWCWNIMQAMAGDGQNRNALCSSVMYTQKRVNNWVDLKDAQFRRVISRIIYDNIAFSEAAISAPASPGEGLRVQRNPGTPMADLFAAEPATQLDGSMDEFIQQFTGEKAQLDTGAFPALFGGNTGSNDTAQGIGIQRDAALGRLGPTWHALKWGEAVSMKQAVRWAAKCRDKSINESVPGGEAVTIEINDLGGNIICFAEADENFPDSFSSKQAKLMQVIQEMAKNPIMAEPIYNPANLEIIQRYVGIPELYIPQVESYEKQLGEIEVLLKTSPAPNPALMQAQQMVQHLTTSGVDPMQLQQAQEEMEALPQEISTVHVDAEVDDNETEAAACFQYLMSEEGRKAKKDNPNGFSNVRCHFLEHKAAAAQNAAGAQQKVSESLAFKDLPPAGQIQEAKQAGIQLGPKDVAQAPEQKAPPIQ